MLFNEGGGKTHDAKIVHALRGHLGHLGIESGKISSSFRVSSEVQCSPVNA